MFAGKGRPSQEHVAWQCWVKVIPDGGPSSFRHGAKQGTAACRARMTGYVSAISADPGGAVVLGVLRALSRAEGTVATSADTVTAWRNGACVGRQPREIGRASCRERVCQYV